MTTTHLWPSALGAAVAAGASAVSWLVADGAWFRARGSTDVSGDAVSDGFTTILGWAGIGLVVLASFLGSGLRRWWGVTLIALGAAMVWLTLAVNPPPTTGIALDGSTPSGHAMTIGPVLYGLCGVAVALSGGVMARYPGGSRADRSRRGWRVVARGADPSGW